MALEFLVKQITGEIKIADHMKAIAERKVVKLPPIVLKCYAHIMNNGHVGMSRKNKTKDSDMNIELIFDGNTRELVDVRLINQTKKEKIYDSSKFVIGL
jgi:hypothetical protein